ncbi:hypothetical protein [Tepidiforma sp.]|uniref:hypothetical protein n=1 Tax=Tepidiforma sp. TaxID=2682230 RepID=UPI0025906C53|nr:hypothetical protein [Tepidiforma sp.]
MAWIRIDDRMPYHPKVVGLSAEAFRLYVASLCYAGGHETDGFVPASALPVLWGTARTAAELERAGLWDRADGGWSIHDYLDYNPSRSDLDDARRRRADAAAAAASARWETPSAAVNKGRRDASRGRRGTTNASRPHRSPDASESVDRMPDASPDACVDDASTHAQRMPNACVDGCDSDASTHANRIANASTQPCVGDAISPYISPSPDDSSSLRSSSSSGARGARDDDDRSPPSSDDWLDAPDDPPEVREIRDLVLTALPRKFAADPLTFDEAAQLGRDYAGAHELVAEAIAECRRRRQLPFPRNLRGILQEARHDSPRDDPVLAQLRAIGALVE